MAQPGYRITFRLAGSSVRRAGVVDHAFGYREDGLNRVVYLVRTTDGRAFEQLAVNHAQVTAVELSAAAQCAEIQRREEFAKRVRRAAVNLKIKRKKYVR